MALGPLHAGVLGGGGTYVRATHASQWPALRALPASAPGSVQIGRERERERGVAKTADDAFFFVSFQSLNPCRVGPVYNWVGSRLAGDSLVRPASDSQQIREITIHTRLSLWGLLGFLASY